jgi:hypothetical protein
MTSPDDHPTPDLVGYRDHVAKHPSVRICRRADIARDWRATDPTAS